MFFSNQKKSTSNTPPSKPGRSGLAWTQTWIEMQCLESLLVHHLSLLCSYKDTRSYEGAKPQPFSTYLVVIPGVTYNYFT